VRSWSGWTGFAALLLVIVGAIDFFEGLIAAIRKQYYVLTPNQVIVFDVKTWGWITMILGIIIVLVGLSAASGAGWARWTGIVLLTINLFEQLGWLGSSAYPLWTLTVITIGFLALYGLTVRWGDNEPARN
jgi:hypothetical protein